MHSFLGELKGGALQPASYSNKTTVGGVQCRTVATTPNDSALLQKLTQSAHPKRGMKMTRMPFPKLMKKRTIRVCVHICVVPRQHLNVRECLLPCSCKNFWFAACRQVGGYLPQFISYMPRGWLKQNLLLNAAKFPINPQN